MQFSILAVAAFAAATIASPVLEGRNQQSTTKSGKATSTTKSVQSSTTSSSAQASQTSTNGQNLQQQCGNNQKLSCCDSVQQQTLNGIPVAVGINCVTINILSVVPVTQQCTTQVACCESGSQVGLVNVANVCPVLL